MKVTLIRPAIGKLEHGSNVDESRMEPLQIGVLAAMTPPDVDVAFYDDRCQEIPYDDATDLVAITVETMTARRAYEISAEYQARGVRVVLGGFHPTLLPAEASQHSDAIVIGDAESVWGNLIQDVRNRRLKPVYRALMGVPQSSILPRRDIFKGKGYVPITLVQFGRGCTNGCTFCAVSAYFQQRHYFRPVSEVVGEIERQGRRFVFFVDDNIVANREEAKRLFRALIPLRIRWVSQGSIDMVSDPELMDLMVASGCLGNVIGFESIDRKSLEATRKTPNLTGSEAYEHEIRILKSYGLQTWAAFVLGLDEDTPESLYSRLEFARRHRFTFAAFNVLTPYPNTPAYRTLADQGRLLYDGRWWLHPDYRFNFAAFRPAQMSADELTEIAFDIRRRWNSPGTILQRFFDAKTNMRSLERMVVYWKYNPLFRREVFRKQGMWFGKR